MKIGLLQVDGKYPNLALMKLATWHKKQGDEVHFYQPIDGVQYDRVYASKVFDFTPDYQYPITADEIVRGGTAYSITDKLPEAVEHTCPDYQMFECDYAMGFTSRGCIRNCSFCLVPRKEGKIEAVADIYEFWKEQKFLRLLDNNLTALPEHFMKITQQMIDEGVKVDFSQGLDLRLITPEMARRLSKVKLWKAVHFAFDNVKDEKAVMNGLAILKDNGVKMYNVMVYVMIGFNSTPEEDLYRCEVLRETGAMPFVMPFNKFDPYQKAFTRWANHKAIFKTVKWEDYNGKAACEKANELKGAGE